MDTADAFRAPRLRSLADSIVTAALVGANVVVYLVLALHGEGWLTLDGHVVAHFGSNFTPWTLGGEPWRLVSSTFIHLGVLHLALNVWALVVVGPVAERLYGPARLALVYFAAGFGASLASVWWHPVVNSAGASGAIFGVLGALLAGRTGRCDGVAGGDAAAWRTLLLAIVGSSLLLGAAVPGVDTAAHVGGLVTGFACGLLLTDAPDTGWRRERSSRRLVLSVAFLATIAAATVIAVQAGLVQPRGAGAKASATSDAPLAREIAALQ
jgi:rhomboid protease GluP